MAGNYFNHNMFPVADTAINQIGSDRRLLLDMPSLGIEVKQTTDAQRRPQIVVTPMINNRNTPEQQSNVPHHLREKISVASDNFAALPVVTGTFTAVTQNTTATSGLKRMPTKKIVITCPRNEKHSLEDTGENQLCSRSKIESSSKSSSAFSGDTNNMIKLVLPTTIDS